MSNGMRDEVVVYHRLLDSLGGERQFEKAIAGTISECMAFLRVQSKRERNNYLAELKDGTLVSAAEIEQIATDRYG